jgi:hypothetical protein
MTTPAPRPAAPAPAELELPPAEPAPRRDPWLSGVAFEVDAFLTGLRPVRA